MSKKWKQALAVLLAVCTSISLCLSSYASSGKKDTNTNKSNTNNSQYTTYSLQDMRAMAMNALLSDFIMDADNGTWENVEIVKETPLYDVGGKLISYCFDLKCEQQGSYIIVSATSENYPIMQFAAHATSQYLEIDNPVDSVYIGPGQYYIEGDEKNSIINLISGETIELENVDVETSYSNEVVEDFDEIAQLYISGDILNQPVPHASDTSYTLYGVPNYSGTIGCAPSAMAMILAYHYSGFTSLNLIRELARNMGTDTTTGRTKDTSIVSGAKKTLKAHNKSYTSIAYAAQNKYGIFPGPNYNTFDAYKSEILANRPVFIVTDGAKYTTNGYPDGFGDHALVGMGYECGALTNYVIVYTTVQKDGSVKVPLNSTSLGNYAWCYVVP